MSVRHQVASCVIAAIAMLAASAPSNGQGVDPLVCHVADPGPIECTGAVTIIQLDGSGSTGPPGFTYDWTCDCPGAIFSDQGTATPTLTVIGGCDTPCGVTLTVDGGGATDSGSMPLVISDTQPPVLAGCPFQPNVSVQCGDPLPTVPTVTAVDICGGVVPVTFHEESTPTACPGILKVVRWWTASDACGNTATCAQYIHVLDTKPPAITCPPDRVVTCDEPTDPDATGFATAVDDCDDNPNVAVNDETIVPTAFPTEYTILREWIAVDACGNDATCIQKIKVICPSDNRVSATEKGSLLIFSKVEIRWDAAGNLIQDTFVGLVNDLAAPVALNLYFVNGDPPLAATADERAHPGWNWVDVKRTWTANQPAYWSAFGGGPGPGGAPVAPFTVLDPSGDPTRQGRPATDGTMDRVLRGYVIAFAVDEDCCPIAWNHLEGDATLVNYAESTAWAYNAWAFQDGANSAAGTPLHGCETARLSLNGRPGGYVMPYAMLLLDFYAPGSDALSTLGHPVTGDTSLTLHPIDADLRQETRGPVSTKASFVIWNEDETQFTNLHRCITCWDQTLLSMYTDGGVQNHFLSLQTDKGKARIDGIASRLCASDCCLDRGDAAGCDDNACQEQVCAVDPACCDAAAGGWDLDCAVLAVDLCETCRSIQIDTPLLGVAHRRLSFGGSAFDASGVNLVGMGREATSIEYDPAGGGTGGPPTLTAPDDGNLIEALLDLVESSRR